MKLTSSLCTTKVMTAENGSGVPFSFEVSFLLLKVCMDKFGCKIHYKCPYQGHVLAAWESGHVRANKAFLFLYHEQIRYNCVTLRPYFASFLRRIPLIWEWIFIFGKLLQNRSKMIDFGSHFFIFSFVNKI